MTSGQISLPTTPTPWFQQNAPSAFFPTNPLPGTPGWTGPRPVGPTPLPGSQPNYGSFGQGPPGPGYTLNPNWIPGGKQPMWLPPLAGTTGTSVPFPTEAQNAAAALAAAAKTTTPPPAAGSTDYSHRLPGESTQDWVVRWAKGNNRPDIAADPSYWVSAINSKPQSDDMGYWLNKIQTPDTGGSGDSSGFGAFTAPFTGTYVPPVTNFQAPVGTDDPGFQFAVQQGQDAIQRSAAAKGNLLTGGTLKDLASYTTGAALQDYAGSYNRALSTAGFNNNTALGAFGTNYDIFRNNQNDPFQKLYATTGLGLNAAGASNAALSGYGSNAATLGSQYGNNLASLTGQGATAGALGTQVGSAQQNQWYQSSASWLQSHPFS